MKREIIAVLLIFLSGCVSSNPPAPGSLSVVEQGEQPGEAERLYSVYLVGDAGEASLDPLEPSLDVLRHKLQRAGKKSAVVFLGDNIYPHGLPPKNHKKRKKAENRLLAQFQVVKNYEGQVVFVAGNHDWNSSRKKGLEQVRRQEHFVEETLNRGNVFLPDDGQPGPAVVNAGSDEFDLSIIALNTQWWLHPYEKPGGETQAAFESTNEQVIDSLKKAVTDASADQVLVVGHHPMYSNGTNGGRFPLKTHLLPPVGGSLYVLYRNIWGTRQDIASAEYEVMKEGLTGVFDQRDPLVYASGHDHSLQYINKDNQHYIVSGSATVTSYVKEQCLPNFGMQRKGFSAVHYYQNSIWVEFWSEDGKRLFEQRLGTMPEQELLTK